MRQIYQVIITRYLLLLMLGAIVSTDIDECETNTSECTQNCKNTLGSYTCSCDQGYFLEGDGHTCSDIDECETKTSECTQICKNTLGSYTCSCYHLYFLEGDGHTCSVDCGNEDRVSGCNNIEDHTCYSPEQEIECCKTCYNRRRPLINVDDCLYGDWEPSCSDTRFHSSECYNMTRRQLCCETCNDMRTTNENCLYGDKALMCQTIMPTNVHLCYQLESSCCQSCLQYRDDNFPDCKYGDTMSDCLETECGEYSDFDLPRCCRTCKDYAAPVITNTTPSSTSISTPTTYTGVTQIPDKQKGTSIGPIVGGAVGGVIVIVIIIAVACFLVRRSRTDKPRQQSRPQQVRSAVSYKTNPPNPPYNRQPRPPDTDDEVYNYIHPDDVRTVVSEPAFRPSLPDRTENDTDYMEPVSSIKHCTNNGDQLEDPDFHAYQGLQNGEYVNDHTYISM